MGILAKIQTERRCEIVGVFILTITALLFLTLVTDEYRGENQNRSLTNLAEAYNVLGPPGAVVATIFAVLVGHAAHVLYVLLGVWGLMFLQHTPVDRAFTRFLGAVVLLGSVAGLVHIDFPNPGEPDFLPGGVIGDFVARLVSGMFGRLGANVILIGMAFVGVLLATEFLFFKVFLNIHGLTMLMLRGTADMIRDFRDGRASLARDLPMDSLQALTAKRPVQEMLPVDEIDETVVEARRRDPARINIRPILPELGIDAATPFDAIPEAPARSDTTATVAPSVEAVDDEVDTEAGSEGEGTSTRPTPTNAGLDKKKPMPRRKASPEAELPPDYTYPKRYTKPSIDMLFPPETIIREDLGDRLRETSLLLEDTLATFGIEAQVTDVTRGPTITRFELEPAPGIKVSRFQALADDLALALKAYRVRVEAPIPGKGRVGIEVPNEDRDPVVIRELLESRDMQKRTMVLPIALGKDIAGDVTIADLTKMPHLLVAGATGAGKTVCVKSILASFLFCKTPEELQLMLIDPKMVELSIFNDIPHLITPVVTDPKKASLALSWLINEMNERYHLFAHLRVRNIEVYNESVDNGEIEMEGEDGEEGQSYNVVRKLPYIVCVIDELADLMMLARAEVEDSIARLAQLARAVGIHLIIATQRPSVDVLTGVIKANFPARLSFQVSSRVDSRCILDEIGAEKLIGMGDLLYLPAGQSKPTRVQGAFVSDEEMNSLIAYLKTQAPPQYRDEIEKYGGGGGPSADFEDEDDELFDEAVRVVLETGQASISMIQRRLRVGYTRAARLIDILEQRGVVGPHCGSKAREILVSRPPEDEDMAM